MPATAAAGFAPLRLSWFLFKNRFAATASACSRLPLLAVIALPSVTIGEDRLATARIARLTGFDGVAFTIAIVSQALPAASSSHTMARKASGGTPLFAAITAIKTLLAAPIPVTVQKLAANSF